jgi:hypothetical protein
MKAERQDGLTFGGEKVKAGEMMEIMEGELPKGEGQTGRGKREWE